jgi:DNA-directed RNA polymerase specialized sigma24 family protein
VGLEYATEFVDWSCIQAPVRGGTDIEALMGARPHEDPDMPLVAQLVLREALSDCFEQLSDQDRYILEAIWFEGISYRTLATRMGLHKSYTHRIVQRAVSRLGELCEGNPTILSHLSVI